MASIEGTEQRGESPEVAAPFEVSLHNAAQQVHTAHVAYCTVLYCTHGSQSGGVDFVLYYQSTIL